MPISLPQAYCVKLNGGANTTCLSVDPPHPYLCEFPLSTSASPTIPQHSELIAYAVTWQQMAAVAMAL